jgi:hypothetical protein
MTGAEAYWFSLQMVSCLLVAVLPATFLLMRVPRNHWIGGLVAGAAGWTCAAGFTTLAALALPGSPLRTGGPASDIDILISIATALAITLATVASALIALFRRLDIMPAGQVCGTVTVIAACWCAVVGTFAWLVLA